MQPPLYSCTQSCASLALPDYLCYFRLVRLVRQRQTSPVPSVSSSRYKQRWQSSLHDTQHPIMLRWSLVLRTSFVLRRSSALMVSFLLRRSSRDLTGLTRDSTSLNCASTVLARRFISHVTRSKVWSMLCSEFVYLVVYKTETNITNTVRYYSSITGEK